MAEVVPHGRWWRVQLSSRSYLKSLYTSYVRAEKARDRYQEKEEAAHRKALEKKKAKKDAKKTVR